MWQVYDAHSLAALYALIFLGPFVAACVVFRLAGWWRGL